MTNIIWKLELSLKTLIEKTEEMISVSLVFSQAENT